MKSMKINQKHVSWLVLDLYVHVHVDTNVYMITNMHMYMNASLTVHLFVNSIPHVQLLSEVQHMYNHDSNCLNPYTNTCTCTCTSRLPVPTLKVTTNLYNVNVHVHVSTCVLCRYAHAPCICN